MLSWLIVWMVQGAFEFGFAKLLKGFNFNKKKGGEGGKGVLNDNFKTTFKASGAYKICF